MSILHTRAPDAPLTALRAFVAVGRHGSFTRAADSLGITQSAVSRHISTLETFADCRLFVRRGSTIEFTPPGLQLFEAVKDALSTIELTMQLLAQRGQRHDRLKVRTSLPSFAMTVVIPSLGAYTAKHGVQIDLITSLSPPQTSDDFDVLISRDLSLPGTECWELVREELICVASPAVIERFNAQPEIRMPMVAARSRPDVIAIWALAADVSPDRLHVVATYDHLFLAATAAIGGAGFLVVPQWLVLQQLQVGSLVSFDNQRIGSGASYVAYVHAHSAHAQTAGAFCRWLKASLRDRASGDECRTPGSA
ncbi:LysR family transcriptional regulator [Bordetella genomosp. 4]|uniref:LysR family transcriptional regulator n=1 Tax=Bordetella genomosp. 4 TaxID=463044 RepID=A0A261TMD8_9BORD|nr:LysR family transcriptional regulator [Bordetella genomosp. 4]OZI50769.1 LysR family transcriptional regulator [Bordetella genomosp. 4]